MKISLLGPLTLDDEGHDITPSAPKQRGLLALLLLNANTVVPVDDCIRELWDGDPPTGALGTVHSHMTRLRQGLAAARSGAPRLMTRGRGYVFAVKHGEIDLAVFTSQVDAAKLARTKGDRSASARMVGGALDLWRAPVLVDVAAGPLSSVLRGDLFRRRLDALCMRIDLDLELGRHHQLISELSALGHLHPADEGIQQRLMTALYRCGRQVEALRVYWQLRKELRIEYGVVPSTGVDRLHTAILTADPELDSSITDVPTSLDLVDVPTSLDLMAG